MLTAQIRKKERREGERRRETRGGRNRGRQSSHVGNIFVFLTGKLCFSGVRERKERRRDKGGGEEEEVQNLNMFFSGEEPNLEAGRRKQGRKNYENGSSFARSYFEFLYFLR